VGGVGHGFLFAALLFSTYRNVENRAKGDVGLLTVSVSVISGKALGS